MASTTSGSKKLRVLLIPFFASSHIGPFTELAVSLATARPHAVEATIAVTPANAPFVRSLLQRHENGGGMPVKVARYPFPAVDGLPRGVENPGAAAQADAWRIDVAALSDTLMRPVQETLIGAQSPDAVVTDVHFMWNAAVCDGLGVPCVTFNVIGAFSTIAMRHLLGRVSNGEPEVVTAVPRFPAPEIRVPTVELPEFLRSPRKGGQSTFHRLFAVQGDCFGLAVNTPQDLEEHYCGMYVGNGYAKRAYMLGPLSLRLPWCAGGRSTRHQEKEVVPAQDVARALTTFMKHGGPGDAARSRVMGLAAKVHAAVAEGGSSDRDLHRLIDDLMEAVGAGAGAGRTTI